MPETISIRPASFHDCEQISRLAMSLSEKYVTEETIPGAAQALRETMRPEGIEKNLRSGYQYHVAILNSTVVGVIGLKDHHQLIHLFVAEQHHRNGIARALWDMARAAAVTAGNQGEFSVSASLYAEPVYKNLGFESLAGPTERNGVVFVPMQCVVE